MILPEKDYKILSIETSFDETAVAVLKGRKVISNVVSSSTNLHKKWGGVVPDIARRAHIENIDGVYKEALKRARMKIEDIEYIAVTYGPGLAIDLEVGLDFAKNLAKTYNKEFLPINHMEGHLLSCFTLNSKGKGIIETIDTEKIFPAVGVLVSGNHTELILVKDFGQYEKIGETLDDAAGEAFDKVGRMLDLGFPGGPIVSEFAKKGKKGNISFSIPMMHSNDYNFSYSGLKTACLYRIEKLRKEYKSDKEWIYDFCFGFVDAVAQSLMKKLKKYLDQNTEIQSVFVGGGVMMNEYIVRNIGNLVRDEEKLFLLPQKVFRTDNATMIGSAAYFNILHEKEFNRKTLLGDIQIDRNPRLELGDTNF